MRGGLHTLAVCVAVAALAAAAQAQDSGSATLSGTHGAIIPESSEGAVAETVMEEPSKPEEPPLQRLHCANSEEDVTAALDAIEALERGPAGVPTTQVGGTQQALAADIDGVLRDFARIHAAMPALRWRVERIILSWNFCDIFFAKRGWDLVLANGQLWRRAANPPEDGWKGFLAWGFEANKQAIPLTLLDSNSLFPSQRAWFSYDVFESQCIPSATSGRSPFDAPRRGEGGGPAGSVSTQGGPQAVLTKHALVSCEVHRARAEVELTTPAYGLSENNKDPVGPKPGQLSAPALSGPEADAPTTIAVPSNSALRLSGSFFFQYATGSGRPSTGARVSYAPWPNTYVRLGITQQLMRSPTYMPSYSWGIGYSDWHAGTCSIELNNWGPTPVNRFDILGSQIDVGCKPPVPRVIAPYVGWSLGATFPFKAAPSYGAMLSLKTGAGWFALAGIRWAPSRDQSLSWTYGFGYWRPSPYTFSLAYNNWGPNSLSHFNFNKNGSIVFAWSWAL